MEIEEFIKPPGPMAACFPDYKGRSIESEYSDIDTMHCKLLRMRAKIHNSTKEEIQEFCRILEEIEKEYDDQLTKKSIKSIRVEIHSRLMRISFLYILEVVFKNVY